MVIGFFVMAVICWYVWVMVIKPIIQIQSGKRMQEQSYDRKREQERLQRMSQTHSESLNQPKELTPTQKQNLEYLELILDCLAISYEPANGLTCTQIQKNIPEFERFDYKKVSALTGSLVKAGKVIDFTDKGKRLYKLNTRVVSVVQRKMHFEQYQEQRKIKMEEEKQKYLNMSEIERVENLRHDIEITVGYLCHNAASLDEIIDGVRQRRHNFPCECSQYVIEAVECLTKVGVIDVKGDEDNRCYSIGESLDEEEYSLSYSELVKQANLNKSISGISAVDKMEGHQFEHYCADLLRKLSFLDVEVTKGSGDQGVDIIAVKEGIRYAIQCKCYSSPLGNSPVQEVNAGKQMYHCHVAVVLTNQYFTSGAKELAGATGVLLWDRDELAKMIQKAQEANK